jgi:ferritin-like metal-binding protein YciE
MEPKNLVLQYLDEAHATETALVTNLRAHIAMTTEGSYRSLLERHLDETQRQVKAINRRRNALGGSDGRGVVATAAALARDVVLNALVLTKGPLDAVRTLSVPERMLKNARDECATEAIEIAIYDMLEAAAKAAGDEPTARLAREHRSDEERMLADLRKEIPKLAVLTVEDRTDGAATRTKPTTGRSTTRRSTSGRATSSGRKTTTSTRRKASTAKKSTASKSTSRSTASKSGGTRKKSTTTKTK